MASANNMVKPIPNARREEPYLPNGALNVYPGGFYYKPRKDVGEKGIDEEVHGMVVANSMVKPIPNARRQEPYEPNGFKNVYPGGFYYKPRKDVGEKGIDEEVHGMVSANSMVKPIPNARREEPYLPNGALNVYPGGFYYRSRKDVGEKGLDAEVHGIVS
jgi:hypothetical protein